jgi:iron complex outermembrane receptor protein
MRKGDIFMPLLYLLILAAPIVLTMRNWAFLFCGFAMLCFFYAKAQQSAPYDTMKTLKVFEVVDSRLQWNDASSNLIQLRDNLPALPVMDFGDRLSLELPVFVRNYGPGSLSSLSVRGFSAQHTGFIWNGFNIQSSMNGMVDMSLFPTWLLEDVAFRQGPSTDSWGNGNIAGTVVTQSQFGEEPFSLSIHQALGSFGLWNNGLKTTINKGRWNVKVGLMRRKAVNDFPFRDHSHPDKIITRQKNAEFLAQDVMAGLHYRLSEKHRLSFDFWGMQAERGIPGIMSVPVSLAQQQDVSIKNNLAYHYAGRQSKITFRSAFFIEGLNFQDSLMQIDSESQTQSFLNDFLYETNLKRGWKMSLNLFSGIYTAHSTGYNQKRAEQERRVALLALEKNLFEHKLILTGRLRKEWIDGDFLPFTPSVNIGYSLPHDWKFNAGGALSYRVPTFNDLYWIPGGNPNLNPEDGRHLQANIHKTGKVRNISFDSRLMLYRSEVLNWIQWQPQNAAIWTPENIKTVLNQGLEWYVNVQGKISDWQWYVRGNAAYVSAKDQGNAVANGESDTYQLIYVPAHQANIQIGFANKRTAAMFYHQYTGIRHTTTDNSQHLPAFQLSGIQLSHTLKWKQSELQVFATCNNIFNVDYQVMMMRAMPGRNIQMGLNLHITARPSTKEKGFI